MPPYILKTFIIILKLQKYTLFPLLDKDIDWFEKVDRKVFGKCWFLLLDTCVRVEFERLELGMHTTFLVWTTK